MRISPPITIITILGIVSAGTALYWAKNSPKELLDMRSPPPVQPQAAGIQGIELETETADVEPISDVSQAGPDLPAAKP